MMPTGGRGNARAGDAPGGVGGRRSVLKATRRSPSPIAFAPPPTSEASQLPEGSTPSPPSASSPSPSPPPLMTFIADEGEVAPIVELSETLLSPPIRSPLDVFALDGAICKLDTGVMNALPGCERFASPETTNVAPRSTHTHTSTASITEGRQRRLRRLRRLREHDHRGDAPAAAASVSTKEDAGAADIEREAEDV